MENLIQKNLDFLERELPQVYKRYRQLLDKHCKDEVNAEYIGNASHHNILLNGKPAHSIYSPDIDGQIMSIMLNEEDYDTIFVFGIGMGHHINEMCKSFPEKNKIFYEPNFDVFCELLKVQDLEKLYSKNVMFLLSDDRQSIVDSLIHLFTTFVIYKVTFIGLPTYIAEYSEDWTYITKGYVDFFMRYSVNLKTLIKYNNSWMINIFKNLRHYPFESGFDDFKEKFKGVPGIVVSSGPSLKKNMHLLKDILDKAVVVSAGSSINALDASGIIPHIMLAVDGSQLMSDEYNAVKDNSILFAHIMNVHFDCIEKYKGPKLHFKVSSEMSVEYYEKVNSISSTTIGSGGSCANVAMDFLAKLGCNPIVLIGQDLCFTGNVTHSEGVWDRKEITTEVLKSDGPDFIKKKDIFGDDVFTNRVFSTIHKWFEDYIRANETHSTGLKVINATEGGLPIQGAENMSFSEAIRRYCKEDRNIKARLMDIHTQSLCRERENKKNVKHFLDSSQTEFKKIERMSKSRIELLQRIFKRLENGNSEAADLRSKINKITEKMEKNMAYNYLIWLQSFEMIYNIKNAYEIKAKEEKEVAEKLKVLYQGLEMQFNEIHMRIRIIRELVEKTLQELKSLKEWDDVYGQTG
ncbi:MAG: DUF115 domain-containing protein [Clostridia bacterium]|nr:DUF115 domain-containing protein [Clostridia bacterium]